MKLTFFLIILLSSKITFGQTTYAGQYKSNNGTTSSIFNQVTLNLNCDRSFMMQDSSFTTFGKWTIKHTRILILTYDSSKINSKTTHGTKKIELAINEDKLYWKGFSKKEYRKLQRTLDKALQEPPILKSYFFIKNKESNYYLRKVNKFTCE